MTGVQTCALPISFGNFLYNNQSNHQNNHQGNDRDAYADRHFEHSDSVSNKQMNNSDTHNRAADGNGADNKRPQSGQYFEQVLERNFREAFEAEFRQKQKGNTLEFLKQNWFTIGLGLAILFFIFKKDFVKIPNGTIESTETVGKKGNKLTIASNKTTEDTPLSIGGAWAADGDKSIGAMHELGEDLNRYYL